VATGTLPAEGLPGDGLPERRSVHWRPLVDERRLRRRATLWTATTTAHVVPFVGAAAALAVVQPLALPVSLVSLAHAWVIPELYAHRGANVVRPKPSKADPDAERVSAGLLGDLVGHEARALHAATGLVLERASLGVWLVGPAGALLVRPGGRRVHCYCVRVDTRSAEPTAAAGPAPGRPELPTGDRIAHLLLALRSDERGFATVANLAFSGALWRVRRRLPKTVRPALDAAARAARTVDRRAIA
jgi:hypothetical protein